MGSARNLGATCDPESVTPDRRFVCPEHVEDQYLRRFIEESDEADPCSFCKAEDSPGIPIHNLAEIVRDAVHRYYTSALDAGVPWDSEESEWALSVLDTSDGRVRSRGRL